MLRIDNIRMEPGAGPEELRRRAAAVLRLPPEELGSLTVLRRSIDARGEVSLLYSVRVSVKHEERILRRCRSRQVSRWQRESYTPPAPGPRAPLPPVVIGAGPAGLFCALLLAGAGLKPILLERGRPVEERRRDVERFWAGGPLDPESNVQFGEGGAGTFSDGTLNTGTRDPRHRFILEKLAELGGPEEILCDARPHVGTDRLYVILQNLRRRLLDLGAELRFGHRVEDFRIENGRLVGLVVEGPEGRYDLPVRQAALAPGHSARDTFQRLARRGVVMEAKPLAVGVRIEHSQAALSRVQYGAAAALLPAASYKLSCHLPGGRGVFSFCVCPGGQVVAAASEPGRLVTNGMSPWARDGANINGGLLVGVAPADFGGEGPLAGIAFQRRLEAAAFALGGGDYRAPAQLVGDFLAGRPSAGPGAVLPTYRPGVTWTDLRRCLPDFVHSALAEALPLLDRKLPGFAGEEAVLTAVESRSSSPVRILRDQRRQASAAGLYPCGEGAGYAGGIMSAAADGMQTAEQIWEDIVNGAFDSGL